MKNKIVLWMGLYFTVCFLAQIWPLAGVANCIEPFVLGLPFFFFWYIAWALAVFLGYLHRHDVRVLGMSCGFSGMTCGFSA